MRNVWSLTSRRALEESPVPSRLTVEGSLITPTRLFRLSQHSSSTAEQPLKETSFRLNRRTRRPPTEPPNALAALVTKALHTCFTPVLVNGPSSIQSTFRAGSAANAREMHAAPPSDTHLRRNRTSSRCLNTPDCADLSCVRYSRTLVRKGPSPWRLRGSPAGEREDAPRPTFVVLLRGAEEKKGSEERPAADPVRIFVSEKAFVCCAIDSKNRV
mmetsp:Transcript_22509/g.44581  ORF Transcript_22509/g.44581 Transcript_22509/m.44581 type:complete len:215 (+) Transcript_22509:1257-1901(+)